METTVQSLLTTMRVVQSSLLVITALGITSYMYPQSEPVPSGSAFDFVIVGAGSGGCVIANRLSEIPNFNILLIEAGDDLPLESMLPGIFPMLPNSVRDYNYTSENDGYTSQNLRDEVSGLTAGKMIGGSGSLQHMMHVRGNSRSYDSWAQAAQDESWNYDNLFEYFIKSELLEDQEIIDSDSGRFHGTDGYIGMARLVSQSNVPIIRAFTELGYQSVLDLNDPRTTVGIGEPLLNAVTGRRFGGGNYLMPLIDRPNFHMLKNTQVNRVLFDEDNNAIGVEATTSDGESITIYANNEVIVSAGTLNTPKLLMLSGVGPRDHLESLNIPVISDLPVGQNLRDHTAAVQVYALNEGEAPRGTPNPRDFPVPTTIAFGAVNINQGYPDYVAINLAFPPDSIALLQMCSMVFTYKDEICQEFFDSVAGRHSLFVVQNVMAPESSGEVLLRSVDPADSPIVRLSTYSNDIDLDTMARSLQDFARIGETDTFRSLGATRVDLDLPECFGYKSNSYEYWRCYALAMSSSMWHYCGTAAMGTVLDNRLRVRGVQGLRVVDASAMPNLTSGKINAAVYALAEKGADLIKADYGGSPRSH